jgi:hypothetical protein
VPVPAGRRAASVGEAVERYRRPMPFRLRIVAFASAGFLVVAGVISAALVGGLTGEVLAIGLIGMGLGGALLLLFLEVGLSEDQARARMERRQRRRAATRPAGGRRLPSGRRRGH